MTIPSLTVAIPTAYNPAKLKQANDGLIAQNLQLINRISAWSTKCDQQNTALVVASKVIRQMGQENSALKKLIEGLQYQNQILRHQNESRLQNNSSK